MIKRSVTGLRRTGSIITNGSVEVVIGFLTANKVPHDKRSKCLAFSHIHEQDMDEAFRAVGEATGEAVLNSLITATSVVGRAGHTRPALKDLLKKYQMKL